jgi:predicted HTH transcriptional regulator
MSDFQTEMNRVVQGFVAQITDLARRAAIDTLESALTGRGARRGKGAALTISRGRGKGAKRSSDELEKLSEQFVEFVRANPGLRIEQINKQLGTSTKDLALPIRKLVSDGTVKAKGQKRSTTYFAGEGRKRKKS